MSVSRFLTIEEGLFQWQIKAPTLMAHNFLYFLTIGDGLIIYFEISGSTKFWDPVPKIWQNDDQSIRTWKYSKNPHLVMKLKLTSIWQQNVIGIRSHLNGNHVAFGQVINGFDVLDKIEECGDSTRQVGLPTKTIKIINSGTL